MKRLILACAVLAGCAPKAAPSDAAQLVLGERAYRKCFSCHALEPRRNDLQGPTLYGIVGRRVAAEPGFDYSPALRRYAEREPRWTEELVGRFAADPENLVPGTSMSFQGLRDAEEREALIQYLKHQTRARAANLP